MDNNETPPPPLKVKAAYTLPGNETQSQEFASFEPATLGLLPDQAPFKPEPGDYSYCGRHDSGAFLPPREGGPLACLIASIRQAKDYNDAYLTKIIEQEKQPPTKKPKVEE